MAALPIYTSLCDVVWNTDRKNARLSGHHHTNAGAARMFSGKVQCVTVPG